MGTNVLAMSIGGNYPVEAMDTAPEPVTVRYGALLAGIEQAGAGDIGPAALHMVRDAEAGRHRVLTGAVR